MDFLEKLNSVFLMGNFCLLNINVLLLLLYSQGILSIIAYNSRVQKLHSIHQLLKTGIKLRLVYQRKRED